MKRMLLISILFCFIFAHDDAATEKVVITSESKVEMYTAFFWAPCKEAKALLQSRGIEYETHLITLSRKNVMEMGKRTNGKSFVPQIIVDDHYFGGLAELKTYFKNKSISE